MEESIIQRAKTNPLIKPVCEHTVPSHPRYVRFIRKYLLEMALDMGFAYRDAVNIKAAFVEALNNVIEHAYKGKTNMPIHLEFYRYDDRLEILIRDYGEKVARSEIKPRDLGEYVDGGLGVYLMEKLMDYVDYDTTVDAGTRLKMVKKL
ncbi:MAG: ATP-binding protein [Spirochaetia bacterium]|nr:ATP-binding protein [Spirochaetia bacterium]